MLLPFEEEKLRKEYKNYFIAKRTNYFASIESLPDLWDCYLSLDEIWMREFSDLERISNTGHIIPLELFLNSHAQFRVAFELAFATCLAEAQNIVRSCIETVAVAHKIHGEPKLALVWSARSEGPGQKKAYRAAFEPDGKKSLFIATPTLVELYRHYQLYSDWGTHPTIAAIAMRHSLHPTQTDLCVMHNYLESDLQRIATFLYSMLEVCSLVEQVCFTCFKDRLNLDQELVQVRAVFQNVKARTANQLVERFHIPSLQMPAIIP